MVRETGQEGADEVHKEIVDKLSKEPALKELRKSINEIAKQRGLNIEDLEVNFKLKKAPSKEMITYGDVVVPLYTYRF